MADSTVTILRHSPPLPRAQLQPPPPPPSPPLYDLPRQDLLADDRRRDYFDICVLLHNALVEGDLEAAKHIIGSPEYLLRYSITENCETALHVVSSVKSNRKITTFVQYLVDGMCPADLQLQTKDGNTALCLAVVAGNLEIAEIMVRKNRNLPTIPNGKGMMPLEIAVLYGNLDMVDYFYGMSNQMNGPAWTDTNRSSVFLKCIELDFFDFALKILEHHSQLAQNGSAFGALARKPYAFNEIEASFTRRISNSIFHWKVKPVVSAAVRLLRKMWTIIEGKPKAEIAQMLKGPADLTNGVLSYPSSILFVAARMGNTKFLVELIRRLPDLIREKNEKNQSIFHVAVFHRHAGIYNLLNEIGFGQEFVTLKDQEGNNLLHLVGMATEESQVHDVAENFFKLQRALLWFKEVESKIPPFCKEERNNNGLTPCELFIKYHKLSLIECKNWIKGIAGKCLVVATPIAASEYAVIHTIPGGYNQIDGFPMFVHKGPFLVFVLSACISFILSASSIFIFFSFFISHYPQEDFIKSLPRKLLVGLSMFFLSIVAMMISFSVGFFVTFVHKLIAAIFICVVTLIPIFSSAGQLVFLKDVLRSMYGSRYLFKTNGRMLYNQNQNV